MASVSWWVTAAGWFGIVAGAAVALIGLIFFAAAFSGRSVPVGGAGLFVLFTLGVGPLMTLAGVTILVAGFKLMGGHLWARTVLEIFSWIALCATVGYLIYSAGQQRHIESDDVIQGALIFLVSGGPAILMLLLLHSSAVQRALTR
jgi:hypothetical protein